MYICTGNWLALLKHINTRMARRAPFAPRKQKTLKDSLVDGGCKDSFRKQDVYTLHKDER